MAPFSRPLGYIGRTRVITMSQLTATERQFLELLPTIDRIAGALARHRQLSDTEIDDFVALVRARFVETQYAPLEQHRGEALMTTYLTVVIGRWLQDLIVVRDGRWRPTAAALRLGPVAVHLERLVDRGCSVDEAVAQLMTEGGHGYSASELRALLQQLPRRPPIRPKLVTEEDAREVPAGDQDNADAALSMKESASAFEKAGLALRDALAALDEEDRLLVTMRYLDGHTLAHIARVLHLEQKPLYRRLERAIRFLRQRLEAGGITAEDTTDWLSRANR